MNNYEIPPEGTPEHDQYMRENFGDDYIFGYRVGFGKRLGAAILDYITVSVLFFAIFNFSGLQNELMSVLGTDYDLSELIKLLQNPESNPALVAISNKTNILFSVVGILYFATEIFLKGSPGKFILGLRIANADMTEGESKNLINRYLIKHINTFISLIALLIGLEFLQSLGGLAGIAILIGFFFTLGEKRQALHDTLSKTAVYHKENIKQGLN